MYIYIPCNILPFSAIPQWTSHIGKKLESTPDLTIASVSLEDCKQLCVYETDFVCQSISYSSAECLLSRKTQQTEPSHFVMSTTHDYYELARGEKKNQ